MFGFGKKIEVARIEKELQDGLAYLVDVRENDEWDAGHARGALHLSAGRIASGEVPTNDTAKKLYLYCASGGRATGAMVTLQSRGYEVENLGPLSSWKGAGGIVEAEM